MEDWFGKGKSSCFITNRFSLGRKQESSLRTASVLLRAGSAFRVPSLIVTSGVLFLLLCRKALKTLNEDMDPLFEKHLGQVFVLCMSDVCMLAPPRPCKLSRFLSIFDQDAKEFLQQGETHEQ